MTNERVLITGAGGFIGFELARHLAATGNNVVGIDLKYPDSPDRNSFTTVVGDFREPSIITSALDDVSTVFHLASAHLDTSMSPSEYRDINVQSLPSLLQRARDAGVRRFVHVSSVGVYGHIENPPANEDSQCAPQSIYGETKLAGEKEVLQFWRATRLPVVIVRPAWVFGATCPRTRKLYGTLKKRSFVMVGRGLNLRHPIYIRDALDGLVLAAQSDAAVGEVIILGGPEAITTTRLIETLCRVCGLHPPSLRIPRAAARLAAISAEYTFSLLGKEPPISRRTLEFFDTNNAFDIEKSRKTLGFNPRFDFAEGLEDCCAALRTA